MNSFKETRDFILLCYDQGILNDEELLVLYEQYKSPSLDLPYSSYPLFDLDDMEDDECLAEFRVKKSDIAALAEALQIPDWISCNQRSKAEGTEALCMLLKRFAYPCRYSDMVPRFARPVPVMSMVTKEMLDYIYTVHSHRIINWNPAVLNPQALQTYCLFVCLLAMFIQAIQFSNAGLNGGLFTYYTHPTFAYERQPQHRDHPTLFE